MGESGQQKRVSEKNISTGPTSFNNCDSEPENHDVSFLESCPFGIPQRSIGSTWDGLKNQSRSNGMEVGLAREQQSQ